MPTTLEILTEARNILGDPAHWTQGSYAKTGQDNSVDYSVNPESDRARCYCSIGALRRARFHLTGAHDGGDDAVHVQIQTLQGHIGEPKHGMLTTLVAFNDTRTYQEVIALFDRTIEREKAKIEESAEGAKS